VSAKLGQQDCQWTLLRFHAPFIPQICDQVVSRRVLASSLPFALLFLLVFCLQISSKTLVSSWDTIISFGVQNVLEVQNGFA
jgi:hypothetical protein